MVGTSTIAAACITLFVSLLLPVIVYIVYGLKNKGKGVWTAWLLGAAGFFLFQMIIRIPILNILSLNHGFTNFAKEHYVVYCLLLTFTAALFEVAGRYIVAKLMRADLTYERGIAAGLGHGGIEAMLLIGMGYINNLIYIALINAGKFDAVVEQTAALGMDTSALVSAKNALIDTESYLFLLAGYERILTMILHVALSLLVCYFVSRGKDWQGIIICLLCHWLVDFVSAAVVGVVSQTVAYVIIYIFLTVVAVVSVLGIGHIKRKWRCLQ